MWFPADVIDIWQGLARSLIDDDRRNFPDRMMATGMIAKTKGFDWDAQWAATTHLYTPFKTDSPVLYTGEFIEKMHDLLVFSNPNKFKLAMPADWLFVNRLQFGLLSVLARLGARVNWADPFRRAVESKTRPLSLEKVAR